MPKHSVLKSVSKQEFQHIVQNSVFLSDILKHFGLSNKGTGNYNTLHRVLQEHNIDYSKLVENNTDLRKRMMKSFAEKQTRPLSEVLAKNSNYNRSALKRRLLREGLLQDECDVCRVGPEWNGKTLVLQLDHKNGDNSDNRRPNLRLLCPNCHSQTENFSGRKVTTKSKSTRAGKTKAQIKSAWNRRKVKTRPDITVLQNQVDVNGYRAVGRMYNVSDNTIRKWLKS